ncbi:MAG: hypothetical protein M1821_001287 [Bathelium mastoideum]|nr:MAG: hypothetical protein M1821_001287 [Bathelium mastoideum]
MLLHWFKARKRGSKVYDTVAHDVSGCLHDNLAHEDVAKHVAQLDDALEETSFGVALDEEDSSDSEDETLVRNGSHHHSAEDLNDLIEDLDTDVQCLVELSPALQSPAREGGGELVAIANAGVNPTITEHRPFTELIRSTFPKADLDLAERLGQLNWERWLRLQEQRRTNEEEGYHEILQLDAETVAPSSKFHDSGVGASLPATTSYAPSLSANTAPSVISSILEGNRPTMPPLPRSAERGDPFTCPACSRLVRVSTKELWKKHLMSDLKPYVCVFSGCRLSFSPTLGLSDSFWIDHLKSEHPHEPGGWGCPLCFKQVGSNARRFCAHISRHMEDIAMATLPKDCESENNSTIGDELTSHGGKENDSEYDHNEHAAAGSFSRSLLLYNLGNEYNEKEFNKLFEGIKNAADVRIMTNSDGTSKGFGYADFLDETGAQRAFADLKMRSIFGKQVGVEFVVPTDEFRKFEAHVQAEFTDALPKLDRTISEVCQDELYDPIYATTAPLSPVKKLKPNSAPLSPMRRRLINELLQQAERHRSQSPALYITNPINNLSGSQEQQKSQFDALAMKASRLSPLGDTPSKTTSSKDAILDHQSSKEDQMSLFPESNPNEYASDYSSGAWSSAPEQHSIPAVFPIESIADLDEQSMRMGGVPHQQDWQMFEDNMKPFNMDAMQEMRAEWIISGKPTSSKSAEKSTSDDTLRPIRRARPEKQRYPFDPTGLHERETGMMYDPVLRRWEDNKEPFVSAKKSENSPQTALKVEDKSMMEDNPDAGPELEAMHNFLTVLVQHPQKISSDTVTATAIPERESLISEKVLRQLNLLSDLNQENAINLDWRFPNTQAAKPYNTRFKLVPDAQIRSDLALGRNAYEKLDESFCSNHECAPPTDSLFLGNLAHETSEEQLWLLFTDVENVIDAWTVVDNETSLCKGFGYARFADSASAQSALLLLHGKKVNGRALRVDYTRSGTRRPEKIFRSNNSQGHETGPSIQADTQRPTFRHDPEVFEEDDQIKLESIEREHEQGTQDSIDFKQRAQGQATRDVNDRSMQVLFRARSLYEYNIGPTQRESGFPHLTYVAGEANWQLFDVLGQKRELWLAVKKDDGSAEVGWIWKKHFARLSEKNAELPMANSEDQDPNLQTVSEGGEDTKLLDEDESKDYISDTMIESEIYPCPFCSTSFKQHHNLKSHLLTHTQEKPYVCISCQARFRRLQDLKRHTRIHTGERRNREDNRSEGKASINSINFPSDEPEPWARSPTYDSTQESPDLPSPGQGKPKCWWGACTSQQPFNRANPQDAINERQLSSVKGNDDVKLVTFVMGAMEV